MFALTLSSQQLLFNCLEIFLVIILSFVFHLVFYLIALNICFYTFITLLPVMITYVHMYLYKFYLLHIASKHLIKHIALIMKAYITL